MTKTKHKQKLNFSSFTLKTAMQYLGLEKLQSWQLEPPPRQASAFFAERLQRLRTFDTVRTERAKELLVDAFCEEALLQYPDLKMWKSAPIADAELTGVVDYLLTPQRDYIDTPLLCVVEAKKDDFEQGLAQCLVEMHACRTLNSQQGIACPLYAIVTNGEVWRFYRYQDEQVYESPFFVRTDIEKLLGLLHYIFAASEANVLAAKEILARSK